MGWRIGKYATSRFTSFQESGIQSSWVRERQWAACGARLGLRVCWEERTVRAEAWQGSPFLRSLARPSTAQASDFPVGAPGPAGT